MELKEIQERLNDRADKVLNEEIQSVMKPLWDRLGHYAKVSLKVPYRPGPDGRTGGEKSWVHTFDSSDVLIAVKKTLFEHLQKSRRQGEVDAFLKKVDDLAGKIQELEDVVEGLSDAR